MLALPEVCLDDRCGQLLRRQVDVVGVSRAPLPLQAVALPVVVVERMGQSLR